MPLGIERLYCQHLAMSGKDQAAIANFSVLHAETGRGLVNYLQVNAWKDELAGTMRTYLVRVRGTNECVGYFSLKAGLVSMGEEQLGTEVVFDTLPGVELANFAVNAHYVRKYDAKGIGHVIFLNFILPLVLKAAALVGISLVYLFALPYPRLLRNYERYGFHRLNVDAEEKLHRRLKPAYDQSCIFMYQPLNRLADCLNRLG